MSLHRSRHRSGTRAAAAAQRRWSKQQQTFRLDVVLTAKTAPRTVAYLRRHLLAARGLLRTRLGGMSVALVGDRQMANLHEQFLGIPGPTDVLTFPLEEDHRGRVTGGEVVVCVPEARRQSKANGTGVERELLLYALHGMLHLCGYDDRTTAAFRTMHATEDRILTQLGVGPVFNHGRPSAPAKVSKGPAGKGPMPRGISSRKPTRATGAH